MVIVKQWIIRSTRASWFTPAFVLVHPNHNWTMTIQPYLTLLALLGGLGMLLGQMGCSLVVFFLCGEIQFGPFFTEVARTSCS